jgi:TatD DNase family protein
VVAIGEIGLDYHALQPGTAETAAIKHTQVELFRGQLELAAEIGKNTVLHLREAFQPELWSDALEMLEPFTGRLRAVAHCFKGTPAQVEQLAAMGHIVSFTGFVLYPEMPQIPATASVIGAANFMLETDCPFQRPPPERDKRCEPAFVRQIAERIARLRGIPLEQLAAETTANAHRFFMYGT